MIIYNIEEDKTSLSSSSLTSLINQDNSSGTVETKTNRVTDRNKFLPKMAPKIPLNHLMAPQIVS